MRTLLLSVLGALCGFSWGSMGGAAFIALAALLPLLWGIANRRLEAGAVALAYYLAASHGLPFGVGIFFEDTAPVWFGWLLWLVVGSINASVWFLLWSKNQSSLGVRAILAIAITALPPLGVVGWNNPLVSSGVFFPGMGFVGLFFMIFLFSALALRRWMIVGIFAGAAVIANVSFYLWPKPLNSSEWSALNTDFPRLQTNSYNQITSRVQNIIDAANKVLPGHVLVLPETILPARNPSLSFAWLLIDDVAASLKNKNALLLVGSETEGENNKKNNVLLALGDTTSVLVQRVPVPIGMWRPWEKNTFEMNLFDSGIAVIKNRKIAFAICYEQLLVFPIVSSMAHRPELLIGAANDWWARDTNIPAIQSQSLDTWGRLFGVPVVRATNY